jgi:hypothetical protein
MQKSRLSPDLSRRAVRARLSNAANFNFSSWDSRRALHNWSNRLLVGSVSPL